MKKNRDRVNRNRRKLKKSEAASQSQTAAKPLGVKLIGDYKSPATVAKAKARVMRNMPMSEVNRIAVIDSIFYDLHPELIPKSTRFLHPNETFQKVYDFYMLDDISQMLPGRKDRIKIVDANGTPRYIQRRVMLMTIGEALKEFKKAHPTVEISKTTFQKLKPKQIWYTKRLRYVGCLCRICENAKLLFNASQLHSSQKFDGIDDMIKQFSCDQDDCDGVSCEVCQHNFETMELLFEAEDPDSDILVQQWQVACKRMTLITREYKMCDLIYMLIATLLKYKKHMKIKRIQQAYFKKCIEESTEKKPVVQFDFSEKYNCIHQNEVQSAHFDHKLVGIFTIAIWAGAKQINKVFVTDMMSSGKFTVGCMLRRLFSQLKNDLPGIESAKIFTDGCAGQFKNHWTLSSIMNLTHFSEVAVEWNFFAPGHGKGAVDGIGGTAKRLVYRKVLSGALQVQNAREFDICMSQNCEGIHSTLIEVENIKDFEDLMKSIWEKVPVMTGIASNFNFTRGNGVLIAKQTAQSTDFTTYKIAPPKRPKSVSQKRPKSVPPKRPKSVPAKYRTTQSPVTRSKKAIKYF